MIITLFKNKLYFFVSKLRNLNIFFHENIYIFDLFVEYQLLSYSSVEI